MKKLKKVLIAVACICMLAACSKSEEFSTDNLSGNNLKKAKTEPKSVMVPFKAHFSVWDHSDYTDNSCGDYPNFFLTMLGNGNATHLGLLTTTMTFCCNIETGVYQNSLGNFVAANGDVIFFEIPIGYIIPNEGYNSEFYQTMFNDPMIITGGTGRFKDVSGNLMTNAYVHNGDGTDADQWRTDFFSTGTLILPKGK